MEESNTDTEEENEDDEEEEARKTADTKEGGSRKDQKDLPSAIVPTINIREERLVDLAETPAFRCLHEVCFSVYCH